MNPAPHLVLVGPMGAGKTSIGRKLADRMGLPFTDVDEEIERRAGTRVSTISPFSTSAYRLSPIPCSSSHSGNVVSRGLQ